MTKKEADSLRRELAYLEDKSDKVADKRLLAADRTFALDLSKSAKIVRRKIEIPETLLHTVKASDDPEFKKAIVLLLKKKARDREKTHE